MQMSAGLRKKSACGPGCADIVAVNIEKVPYTGWVGIFRTPSHSPDHGCRGVMTGFASTRIRLSYRSGLRAKYLSCASCSTCVSSGSRQLSGSTKTTGEFASAPPGTESSGAVLSRQCADPSQMAHLFAHLLIDNKRSSSHCRTSTDLARDGWRARRTTDPRLGASPCVR